MTVPISRIRNMTSGRSRSATPFPGVVFADGKAWDFDAAVNLMDNDIREDLHARGIEDKSTFLWEYIKAHREKFDEDFTI